MSLATRPGAERSGATADGSSAPRARLVSGRHRDRAALLALIALVVVVHLIVHGDGIAAGMDMATQFIPWFAWLGDQLSAGTIPQWNPTVFGGMPSAGDPLSGWGYLPAMLPFGLVDLGAAVHVFLITQLALVATGTYVLARTLRMTVPGALVAAVVATGNGFVLQRNACCVAFVSVEAWIPWLLLGVDRALATTGVRRVGAYALAGLALTQIAGGWFGQGTLYVLLMAGVWLTVRALAADRPWPARLRSLTVTAGMLTIVGLGLSAAVVWPRLQMNPATNLAGGYPGQSLDNWHGGWWPADWTALVEPGIWHIGVTPLVLAAVGLVVARRDRLAWLLGGIIVGALVLALPMVTPLNAPLFIVPGLDRVLTHAPQRVVLIAYPAVALLCGLAATRLTAAASARVASRAFVRDRDPARGGRMATVAVAIGLLTVVGVELAWANTTALARALDASRNPELVRRIDPATFYEPSGAGRFLQRQRDRGDIGRYAAFTPVRRDDGSVISASYFFFWHYPSVQLLEAHNESMPLGLEHVQGYNPIHLARFDDLISTANGRGQDYHVANLFPAAFDRGAFDLLNGRWLVINRRVDHRDPSLVGSAIASWPEVYVDGEVRVLENPDALPRAWLVHDALQVASDEALDVVLGGDVDPRLTAVLSGPAPPLDADGRGVADVVAHGTDRLTVEVNSDGDALLVLSEVYHPAWRATVDGEPADVLPVDHLLRGVAVPSGRHTVELAMDTTVLHRGVAVTVATTLALAVAVWMTRRRKRRTP